MENTTTRISELPNSMNNSQYQQSTNQSQPMNPSKPSEMPTNYVPINVHTNPYGVSDQNPIMTRNYLYNNKVNIRP